jgi:isoquinoline 1-oxidoreductase beta subunit
VSAGARTGPNRRARRRFLIAGAVAGGGLLIGFGVATRRDLLGPPALLPKGAHEIALNAWLRIGADGTVTVAVPRSEMGQGVYTALPMLLAEELGVDWGAVRVEQAPIARVYGNVFMFTEGASADPHARGFAIEAARWFFYRVGTVLGLLITGGSTSVRDALLPMRAAGAAAREMLIAAAARRWGVPARDCVLERGRVLHPASAREHPIGELAGEAVRLPPPHAPRLRPRSEYRIVGRPVPRLDVPAKVDGSAVFGIDVRLPGMRYAAVKTSPAFGGRVASFDAGAIAAMPGNPAVIEIPGGVAVVADRWWRARQALEALPITFEDGPAAALDTEALHRQLEHALDTGTADLYEAQGEVDGPIERASRPVEAEYRAPLLAHATLEPMNCTARVDAGACEIWAPSQAPSAVRMVAAEITGLDQAAVTVHTTYLGGGFGRRSENDSVIQAVTVAAALPGTPVKLVWSREEDMRHDMYRPMALSRFRAKLGSSGRPRAWLNRIASASVVLDFSRRNGLPESAKDNTSVEGAAFFEYRIAARRVEHVRVDTPVPVGFWRSVGHSQNAFFKESFIDELAHAAGRDPYAYRRGLLHDWPRHRRVLDMAAERAGWNDPPPPGRARGIALHQSFGSIVAQVAEVSVSEARLLRVHRVVCVVDCGEVVHPDIVIAQMESGIVFGLTAALFGDITLRAGRVEQSNYHDYRMLRLAEAPAIETYVIESGAEHGGVGECATPPIAPAIANAIFAASGTRVRSLPISAAGFTV